MFFLITCVCLGVLTKVLDNHVKFLI